MNIKGYLEKKRRERRGGAIEQMNYRVNVNVDVNINVGLYKVLEYLKKKKKDGKVLEIRREVPVLPSTMNNLDD